MAFANSALLHPTGRRVCHAEPGDDIINAGHPGFNLRGETLSPSFVAGENARIETVNGIISQPQCLRLILDAHNWEQRTEGFLSHDLHRMIDPGQDSRLEVPALEIWVAAATAQDLRSTRPGIGNLVFYDIHLFGKSHGADIDAFTRARLLCVRALAKCPGLFDDPANKIVGYTLFDINALDRDTNLAGIGESAPDRSIGCSFEIGITQNDHRVLAAQLETYRNQAPRCTFGHHPARADASGECDHICFIYQGSARFPMSIDDLQNICRQAAGIEG